VDLLVVKAGVGHRRRLAQQIYLSLFGIRLPADVLVVTPDDLAFHGNKVGTVFPTILKEGRGMDVA